MVGTAWILDLLNISDHFAFWTRPLSSLENDIQIFFSLQCKIQGIFLAKKVVGHNFWTEGPTDLRSTFLSCIFDAFLGDTPLDHIFSHMPICPYAHYGHIWPIWPYLTLSLATAPCSYSAREFIKYPGVEGELLMHTPSNIWCDIASLKNFSASNEKWHSSPEWKSCWCL